MRSRFTLPITVLALVLLTGAWIVVYPLQGPDTHVGIGFFLGSLFGQSMLTSGWIALGPGGWYRVPLALVWLLAFPCAFFINTILYGFNSGSGIIWVSASMIILLVQMLAWPMRFWLGLRIGQPAYEHDGNSESLVSRQFGIQQLMIVTTVVAVIIGSGRLLLPYLSRWLVSSHESAIFAFLIIAACIICIPLVFAILGMRKPVLPTLVLLAFTAFATYSELPLLASLGMTTGGPDWLHLTLINAFSLLPVVIVCVSLRLADYHLLATRKRKEPKCDSQISVV